MDIPTLRTYEPPDDCLDADDLENIRALILDRKKAQKLANDLSNQKIAKKFDVSVACIARIADEVYGR